MKFEHDDKCECRYCYRYRLGDFFDDLARKTKSGKWDDFVTISYRTSDHPWSKGFQIAASTPNPEFADHFFDFFIGHLEAQLRERLDYIVVNQYGEANGRLHQHCLLAAPGLDEYPGSMLESWLCKNAGYSRVLPFKRGAAFYLARFAGRDLQEAEWRLRLGSEDVQVDTQPKRGVVVARSAEMPNSFFHQSFPGRRR